MLPIGQMDSAATAILAISKSLERSNQALAAWTKITSSSQLGSRLSGSAQESVSFESLASICVRYYLNAWT
jgi:hypothetical protein